MVNTGETELDAPIWQLTQVGSVPESVFIKAGFWLLVEKTILLLEKGR